MTDEAKTTPWDGRPPRPQDEGWCLLAHDGDEREEAWFWFPAEGAYFADGATTNCAYLLPSNIALTGWRFRGRLALATEPAYA